MTHSAWKRNSLCVETFPFLRRHVVFVASSKGCNFSRVCLTFERSAEERFQSRDLSQQRRSFSAAAGNEISLSDGPSKTYYQVLELDDICCDQAEIKKHFRKLAKRYHPDHNPGDEESEVKFKQIQEAYKILADSFKRQLYDQELRRGQATAAMGVDTADWTEHWDQETPEQRKLRRERYKRYAKGERSDMPAPPGNPYFCLAWVIGIIPATYWYCMRIPEHVDQIYADTYNDAETNDNITPLVWAFHNPVEKSWERIYNLETDVPSPSQLYELYEEWDEYELPVHWPSRNLVVMQVPRTQTKYVRRIKYNAADKKFERVSMFMGDVDPKTGEFLDRKGRTVSQDTEVYDENKYSRVNDANMQEDDDIPKGTTPEEAPSEVAAH